MGKLWVVGIGPGDYDNMTIRADRALKESDVIIGYHVYVDLVKERYPGTEFASTAMTREVERCQMALDMAQDALNLMLMTMEDEKIPAAPPSEMQAIQCGADQFVSLISADTDAYRKLYGNYAVKKTLSIPAWLMRTGQPLHSPRKSMPVQRNWADI